MTSWEFPTSDPIDVRISIPDGDISVTAVPTQTATVVISSPHGRDAASPTVEFEAGVLTIRTPARTGLFGRHSLACDMTVSVPPGSSCWIDTAAATVRCSGELGALTARTASGAVTAGRITGPAEITTASGDVRLEQSGPLQAKTVSGSIHVGAAGGDVTCLSVSGSLWIGQVSGGHVSAKTTSGAITVTVVPGLCLQLDLSTLSGRVRSDLDESDGTGDVAATLTCYSLSGDLRLMRGSPVPVT